MSGMGRAGVVLGASLIASLAVGACVEDDKVDPNALDAGASTSSSGAPGGEPNNTVTTCGDLRSSAAPTCPAAGPGQDPTCTDDAPVCCTGGTCIGKSESCAANRARFECFTNTQCPAPQQCCAQAVIELVSNTHCGNRVPEPTLTARPGEGTTCATTCPNGQRRLCTTNADCDGGQCTSIRMLIPSGLNEPFARKVGICAVGQKG